MSKRVRGGETRTGGVEGEVQLKLATEAEANSETVPNRGCARLVTNDASRSRARQEHPL